MQKRSNNPVPGQKLATKVSKSCAIPPYVPGVNPSGWSLISALAGSAGARAPHGKTNGGANEGVSRASHLLYFSCDIFALRSNQLNAWKTLTLSSVTTLREIVTNNVHRRKTNEDWLKDWRNLSNIWLLTVQGPYFRIENSVEDLFIPYTLHAPENCSTQSTDYVTKRLQVPSCTAPPAQIGLRAIAALSKVTPRQFWWNRSRGYQDLSLTRT